MRCNARLLQKRGTVLGNWRKFVHSSLLMLSLASCGAWAADLSSCADDLDRLRKASRDASDQASTARSKQSDLEDCRNDRDGAEYKNDRCRDKASDFESAMSSLRSEMDTVDGRIRSARTSCGYNLTSIDGTATTLPRPEGTGDSQCDLYRGYRGKLPFDALIKTCSQYMSEGDCKRCLAFKPESKK